jgi:hypothetical protein
LRAATDPGSVRLPFPGAWLAAAFAAASVLLVLTLIGSYQRQSEFLDATDWLFLVVQGAGAVLLLVAALLAADTVNLVRARLNRS